MLLQSLLGYVRSFGSSPNPNSSEIELNRFAGDRVDSGQLAEERASGLVAEWVVNPDPIVSAIYTATERQAAFPQDVVNLVTEYLQNHVALKSLSFFGPSDWITTFNKKVEVIKPPPEMDAFLQRINPFTGKLNAESCLCVFIPNYYQDTPPITNTKEEQEYINNPLIPLTPTTMEELAKNPVNPDNQSEFRYYLDLYIRYSTGGGLKKARKELLNSHAQKSYWVLITSDIILGSRNESYSKQQELINEKGAKEYWQVPSIREAIICAFAHYAKTGVRILNDNPCTYTRCIEKIKDSQTIVGGFSAAGLSVDDYQYPHVDVGVVVLRKFAL